MNKLTLTLGTLALCAACNQAPKPFVLEGTLKNCRSDYAVMINGAVGLHDTIHIAPDGTFTFQTVMNEPEFVFLSFSNQDAVGMLLAVNGTNNHVEADLDDLSSWKVTGDLEAAYPLFTSINQSINSHISNPASTFAAYRTDLQQTNDSLLKVSKQIPNEGFQELVRNMFKSSIDMALVTYNDYLAEAEKAPDSDADYNDYMESINLNDSLNYDYAYLYLHWLNDCKVGPDSLSYLDMLRAVQTKATDPAARVRLTKRLMNEYDQSSDPQLDAVCDLAVEMLTDEKDKEWIRQKQTALKGALPGMPAIDCELTDPQGKTLRLNDILGKSVVYIDVWATWCGPCCAEIPYLEKLVEHFKNDNRIRFVSITVDQNKDAWLKKLATDKPAWAQYRCQNFCDLYGISGIPRFMLIGRDGKLIEPNAPRPSDENIISFIEEHVK